MLVFSPVLNIVPLFAWSYKSMLNHKADILCIEWIVCPECWTWSPTERCPFMSETSKGAERMGSLLLLITQRRAADIKTSKLLWLQ